jgi:hypothetical protein
VGAAEADPGPFGSGFEVGDAIGEVGGEELELELELVELSKKHSNPFPVNPGPS